jgi:hypothetical protein
MTEYTIDHQVRNPSHYSRWKIEPIEFIRANNLDALRANIIKYIMRFDAKEGRKDLEKAQQYLTWLIEDWDRESDRTREATADVLVRGTGLQPDLFAPEVLPTRRQLGGGSNGTSGGQKAYHPEAVILSSNHSSYYDSSPSSCEPHDDPART